jgi:uncharacterized protein (DUF952 family)
MRVYHIVLTDVWTGHQSEYYEADSLATEGFIHCSLAEQLEGVIERYYKNAGDITVLEIDPVKLSSQLVFEPSTGGESFPHVYGTINKSAIVGTERRKLP